MKLDLDALHGPALADAGLALPLFDVGEMRSQAHDRPRWMHIGPGNLFRVHIARLAQDIMNSGACLLYTSPSPRDRQKSRMPSSA